MVSAFIPATSLPLTARTRAIAVSPRRAPQMSLRKHAARIAALPTTLATVAPALATEGTGEGLGIDSPLLFLPLILIPAAFLVFYLQFDGSQNKEDFLGEYDQRRN